MPIESNNQDVENLEIVIEETPVESYTCQACYSVFSGEPSTTLSFGDVCVTCHGTCDDCGRSFNRNSGSAHAYFDDGTEMCGRCTRNSYFFCNCCDSWSHNDSSSYVESQGCRICDSCISDYYGNCDACNELVHHESDDHWSNCEREDLIRDYSYRPMPDFNHLPSEFDNAQIVGHELNGVTRRYRKIIYMGFELEVECQNDRNNYRKGAKMLTENIGKYVYLKHDGSLNYGFEIVSHPMTLDFAMANFDWDSIANLENYGFEGWHTDTAGLHVHVSRDGFTGESHQARFVHFFHRNERFLTWLAGRTSSRWASFSGEQMRDLRNKLRRYSDSDRYMAVNLNNSGTLEVRIFQSSMKPERLQMVLQLVDAVVNYTEKLSTKEMVSGDAFKAESFIQWVMPNARYSVLADYLSRWTEPFSSGLPQIGE